MPVSFLKCFWVTPPRFLLAALLALAPASTAWPATVLAQPSTTVQAPPAEPPQAQPPADQPPTEATPPPATTTESRTTVRIERWTVDPVWVMVGVLVVIAVLALLVMAARSGGGEKHTIVKG